MTKVNLSYVRLLYNYLFGITDDELECTFDINNNSDRMLFFSEAKKDFQKFGPKTKLEIINAMEYLLSSKKLDFYWRQVIPHDLPVQVNFDRPQYLRDLFLVVTDRTPNENLNIENIDVETHLCEGWHPSE